MSLRSVSDTDRFAAFDCGAVVNPHELHAQISGGIIQQIGRAPFEAVDFENGIVTNAKLSQYRVPRFTDTPEIAVILMDGKDQPSMGAGETPIIAIAPAVGAAISSARRVSSHRGESSVDMLRSSARTEFDVGQPRSERRWRRGGLLALLGYAVIALAATWPLALVGGARIGGDLGDAWQTLWGFWWLRESLVTLHQSPMFTDALAWPHGLPLWFQSWDLPSALMVLPLWGVLPEVSLYNLALFIGYPLAGLTFFFLCRELWGEAVPAFLGGCLYTFSIYHFGHATALLHVASIQWSPVYFLGLVRAKKAGWKAPVLGGVGLALAAAASIYHLLFCFVATIVLLSCWSVADRRSVLSRDFVVRLAALVGVFLVLDGWLYVGMLRAYLTEPYLGSHDAALFSADLHSFFVPNAVSAHADAAGAWRDWTGNDAENTAYIGFVALALCLLGAVRVRAARPYLAVAATGFVLALGPMLHVNGLVWREPLLPYGWLARALPVLEFGGVPTRFSWLTTFGVAVAAGAGLSQLWRGGTVWRAAAVALTALAVVESWPRRQVTTVWGTPRTLFRQMAADSGRWAVLDASNPHRALWNQVLHGHPMVGGYVTRPPMRFASSLAADPVRRAFFGPVLPERTVVLRERVDSTIDFTWKRGAPGAGLPIDQFSVTWTGTLRIEDAGDHRFALASDDGSSLTVDDVVVIPDDTSQARAVRTGRVVLRRGEHSIRVNFRDGSGDAEVHLSWQPPGAKTPSIVPAAVLRTSNGALGLLGRYGAPVAELGVSADSALALLRADDIRYLIVDGRRKPVAMALGLQPALEMYGLTIYELESPHRAKRPGPGRDASRAAGRLPERSWPASRSSRLDRPVPNTSFAARTLPSLHMRTSRECHLHSASCWRY